MAKYIIILLIFIIAGVFFISFDFSKDSPQESSTSSILEKSQDQSSEEVIETSVPREATKDTLSPKEIKSPLNLFQKKFGLDLTQVKISEELISYILNNSLSTSLDADNLDKAEITLDEKISKNPDESLDEISKLITNYRDHIPTRVKGMLFMKMAQIKGKEDQVRKIALNELQKFTNSTILLIDKSESALKTGIKSSSQIFATYLHASKENDSLIQAETIDIINNINNENISRSIISTYFEIDPKNSSKLIKKLQKEGTLPSGLETYLKMQGH
ncbi:MAG: hypothetical protein DRQ88_09195 [Epsilonproteobacteria bacterium]|nr:MAG: hypothetical protein DRQ89_09325 [Campylobacterota bacterium]RLA65508.1 MAG: hypothetical protein DRQ88_09195 [Campylobacterota bacterium]